MTMTACGRSFFILELIDAVLQLRADPRVIQSLPQAVVHQEDGPGSSRCFNERPYKKYLLNSQLDVYFSEKCGNI